MRISTLRLAARDWTNYGNTPVAFSNGDKLTGCVLSSGQVRIYKNDTLVATVTLSAEDQAFFNPKGGKAGVWAVAASKAFLDNFGGGTVTS